MERNLEVPIKLPAIKPNTSARVKEYLKAYSSSSLYSTRSEYLKPAKISKENTIRSHLSKNHLMHKSDKHLQNEELKKKSELQYDISVAKSDKFEIIRDLSTYELELSNKIMVQERLEKLQYHLGVLPELYHQFQDLSSEQKSIANLIAEGFSALNNLETLVPKPSLTAETFIIREQNEFRKIKLLYQAVKSISGLRVLIKVKGDIFLENFLVSILNCEGGTCINIPIKLDVLAVDTLNHSIEVTTAIEEKIIPHLYLMYISRQMVLKFDEDFPKEKISVVIDLKNYGKASVLVWQFEEAINIHIPDPKFEKKINKAFVLEPNQNLSQIFKDTYETLEMFGKG